MAILEAVADDTGGTTVTSVSASSGINLATASRLMKEMAGVGLLARSDGSGTYRLGPRLFAMARTAGKRGTLLEVAPPVMRELRDASRETVSLHIRVAGHRICVAEIQSPHDVRRVVAVGLTLPLHTGATGQALLAHLPATERDAYVEGLDRSEIDGLKDRLADVRRDGYAWAIDALTRGVSGVAAPVLDGGVAVAVLSVSGPSFRWTERKMQAFARDLLAAAQRLSSELTGFDGRGLEVEGDVSART